MSAIEIATNAKRLIELNEWEQSWQDDGVEVRSVYLGSFMHLDPCGRYHHMLSPNGLTQECVNFWESLETELTERGLMLESGEGDPCDQYASEWREKSEQGEAEGFGEGSCAS